MTAGNGKGWRFHGFVHLPINGRVQGWASTGLYARQRHAASGWLTFPITNCNKCNNGNKDSLASSYVIKVIKVIKQLDFVHNILQNSERRSQANSMII